MLTKKSKKKESWTNILKFKKEYFTLIEYCDYNDFPFDTKQDLTRTPLVKNNFITELVPDLFGGGKDKKHRFNEKKVDVILFKPKSSSVVVPLVDEKTWLKKSVDVLNTAVVNRVTVVLEKNTEKIKLSIFNFSKSRQVGHRYFAKRSDDLHITFNIKTKNFFITNSNFSNRKRTTTTTKNDFIKIRNLLNSMCVEDLLLIGGNGDTINNTKDVVELRDFVGDIQKQLVRELDVKFDLSSFGLGLGEGIMRWFIKVWKIKVPNDYHYYLSVHYPGIRKLRKFKMNLGRAITDNKNLKGKYYIRLINQYGHYNLTDLSKLVELLGEKYSKLVPKSFLKISTFCSDNKISEQWEDFNNNLNLTKHEKLNIVKLLGKTDDPHFLTQIYDHIRIKSMLTKYGLNKRIKSKNLEKFQDEHNDWSNLIQLCERNEQTTYHYQNNFISVMEKDIEYKNERYKVKVLNTDLDYFNEGRVQSHCVRTYLNKYNSIIISVRKNTLNSIERMTCEFVHEYPHINSKSIRAMKDYNKARLLQSRLRFNVLPEYDWVIVESLLSNRFNLFCELNKLEKPKIEIYNKLTGKKFSNGEVDEMQMINNTVMDLPF